MRPTRSPGGRPSTLPTALAPSTGGAGGNQERGSVEPRPVPRAVPSDVGLALDHLLVRDGRPVPRGDVARALGWHPTRLAEIASGRVAPSVPRAFALAALLDCPVTDLYRRSWTDAETAAIAIRSERGWTVAPRAYPVAGPRPGTPNDVRWRAARDLARTPVALALLGLVTVLAIGGDGDLALDLLGIAEVLGTPMSVVRASFDVLERAGLVETRTDVRETARRTVAVPWVAPGRCDVTRHARV